MAATEFVESRRTTETCTSITQERTYTVDTQDPWDALSDNQVPTIGTKHPSRSDMYVIERSAESISPDLARVTIVYSREGYQTGDINQEEIEIDIGAEQERIYWAAPEKVGDKPVKISDTLTGELGVNVYRPVSVITFIQYRSFFNWLVYSGLVGSINKETWRKMPPRTVRYEGSMGVKVGNQKYRIQHRFAYKPEGINPRWPKLTSVDKTETVGGETVTTVELEPELDANNDIIYYEKRVYREIEFGMFFFEL